MFQKQLALSSAVITQGVAKAARVAIQAMIMAESDKACNY